MVVCTRLDHIVTSRCCNNMDLACLPESILVYMCYLRLTWWLRSDSASQACCITHFPFIPNLLTATLCTLGSYSVLNALWPFTCSTASCFICLCYGHYDQCFRARLYSQSQLIMRSGCMRRRAHGRSLARSEPVDGMTLFHRYF